MIDDNSTYSIAVFPFLKTSASVALGRVVFRSTDDVTDLPADQAQSVREIADMLFLQNNLRIQTASYAIVPLIDLTWTPTVPVLANIQAIVAYLYASPHEVLGDLLLSSEHASMVIFTPGTVFKSLVQPDHHVVLIGEEHAVPEDEFGRMRGFDGLYNFRHHFWAAPGSRVYGPEPTMTLNIAQDLAVDIRMAWSSSAHRHSLLLQLLDKPPSPNSARVLTAIRWFNEANQKRNGDEASLVSLAIGFESLLGLPQSEKTERLVDSIALLLGRVPRLDAWAHQFYRARSSIVHEGRADTLRFVAVDSRKGAEGQTYQSLLSYGRRIFQLCLSTLLVGADLARKAGLEDTLVTNEERFKQACKVFADSQIPSGERLDSVEQLVDSLERYRFVTESGLRLETMMDAVRLALTTLIAAEGAATEANRSEIEARIKALSLKDELVQLEAVEGLEEVLVSGSNEEATRRIHTARRLVHVVWGYVFSHYYWLRQRKDSEGSSA